MERGKQYKFIDQLLEFKCPNIEADDGDINYLFDGKVTKETKGEWKNHKLAKLESFWRLLPEM